jgi:hypothetical protein
MSRPNLKIAGDPPLRSPEREQLAEAIARHDAARERLAAIKTAQERAFDNVLNLKDAAAEATTALEQAKADEPRQLVESFIGGTTAEVASPVRAAAAAVEEANARLAAARQMREALSGEEKAAERELQWAEIKLGDAVREAVKADPATARLVAAFNEAERNYKELQQSLGIIGTDRLPEAAKFWNCVHRSEELPNAKQWRAALEALRTDANAPLPG